MDEAREPSGLEALPELSTLVDPVRRRLYDYVGAQPGRVTREEAAAATGVARNLAAYHLDKLVEAGLVEAGYARPEGRGGPGAGRPAKHYTRTDRELSVTVPARSYLLMADVLAQAVAADPTGAVRTAAGRAARRAGAAAAADEDLEGALCRCGYEPTRTADRDIELRNCPFHRLSAEHVELVCGLNLDLVEGILEAVGEPVDRAELRPRAGRCCVVIHEPGAEPTPLR